MLWKSGDLIRGSIELAALYLKCRGEDPKRLVRRDETPANIKQHFDTFRQAQCKGSM
ncbi:MULTISPECIES: hypothetical protein [unclassified Microcystis]|uniref:hypothetical protein n=1 Tax=unclassified Microcystis TaxID=2643300 RepID=UPI00257DEE33|nr:MULTISPECIES: hypothetical protein [unclassified Microcystis]MCA2764960.1 hypothetical protein [Microcystis sp. M151S2]MCA2928742.1 hypothetical protein [Microcystis sp. M020S1]MCA2936048.1 hypothetical protein [Microcystis sp. M015S1]MCA2618064.1 hypothetical protein [Microcystis sp. M099S2]MCA2643150.1 hypothetical protein [Microcystis sp. M087S2]